MLPYKVQSSKVQYNKQTQSILSSYDYQGTRVHKTDDGMLTVTPATTPLLFKTSTNVPRLGVMLVGWGGNNGSTVTASILANKLGITWRTKEGEQVILLLLLLYYIIVKQEHFSMISIMSPFHKIMPGWS